MPAPLGKHVRRPVASRPWNGGDLPGERTRETEAQRKEREACLNCKLPDCMPYSATCPVGIKSEKRVRVRPSEDFLNWAWGPMTDTEWARECGVSKSTIARWRKLYADEIRKRKDKKKNRP